MADAVEIVGFTPAPIGWHVEYEVAGVEEPERVKIPLAGWIQIIHSDELKYYAAIHNDSGRVIPAYIYPDGKLVNIAADV